MNVQVTGMFISYTNYRLSELGMSRAVSMQYRYTDGRFHCNYWKEVPGCRKEVYNLRRFQFNVHRCNCQLKAGVYNDNCFNYQYRNWLFGFTLTLRLIVITCHYITIDIVS